MKKLVVTLTLTLAFAGCCDVAKALQPFQPPGCLNALEHSRGHYPAVCTQR